MTITTTTTTTTTAPSITPELLLKFAYSYPNLQNSWYLIAVATLTQLNLSEEIPKIFHFALRQQLLEFQNDSNLLTNEIMLKLAKDSISSSEKFLDIYQTGVKLPDVLIPHTYSEKLPLNYKYHQSKDIRQTQQSIVDQIREVLLKISMFSGLPKSINSLLILKSVTPTALTNSNSNSNINLPKRKNIVEPIEEKNITPNITPNMNVTDTIDGKISSESIIVDQIVTNLIEGSDYWNTIYSNKLNLRIKKEMLRTYPDLWYFVYHHIYGPLISFTEILSSQKTSFSLIACMIPQDVNSQLKGHLKGAINNGATKEEVNNVIQLVFDICDSLNQTQLWKDGKQSVPKL